MGYVVDKDISLFIPPANIQKTAGTWTPTLASNVWKDVRTAADASFSLAIPIQLFGNEAARGCKLVSIDVYYAIGTAAADDFATVSLEKMTLGADDTAITGAAVTTTIDAGHDTAAERLAVDTDHVMTVTLATPAFIDNDEVYVLTCTVDCAAGTVFTLFGARANFELVL